MSEKHCKKCGSLGPFPAIGRLCKTCDADRKAAWYQDKKATIVPDRERQAANVRRYQKRHPEKVRTWRRNHARERYATDPVYREQVNRRNTESHARKAQQRSKQLFEIEIADEGTTTVVEIEAESAQIALDSLDQSGEFSDDALALSVVEVEK